MTMSLSTTARKRRIVALASLNSGSGNVVSFSEARARMRPAANLNQPTFASRRAPEELNLFAA